MRYAFSRSLALLALALGATACDDSDEVIGNDRPAIQLRNTSNLIPLVKGLPAGVQAYSVWSSSDSLPGMPRFGGSADGAGLLRNADGTFTLLKTTSP
jgi:hypothetical protein